MAANETYNPARAAKQIGIPGSTLRHWCAVYAEFLSPGANPGPGLERRLTDADVETLKAVVQLRANSLQPVEIVERLRANPTEPLQNLAGAPTTAVAAPLGPNTQPQPIETFLSLATGRLDDVARKVETVDDRIGQVDQRLQRVESTRWLVIAVVLAFAAGALTVGVVTWLVAR